MALTVVTVGNISVALQISPARSVLKCEACTESAAVAGGVMTVDDAATLTGNDMAPSSATWQHGPGISVK